MVQHGRNRFIGVGSWGEVIPHTGRGIHSKIYTWNNKFELNIRENYMFFFEKVEFRNFIIAAFALSMASNLWILEEMTSEK